MSADRYALLSVLVESVVALGTVGAVLAALRALRFDRAERRRTEVRGFRAWLKWVDSTPEGKEVPRADRSYLPKLNIKNDTDEFVYDVHATLWPTKLGLPQFSAYWAEIPPGAKRSLKLDVEFEMLVTYLKIEAGGFGVDALFRDARGDRWNRAVDGQLRRVVPVRWYTPWRVPFASEEVILPWSAVRAKWRYRWRDHRERDLSGWPPRWWAVDVWWSRWRYVRRSDPIDVPVWSIRKRWAMRQEIAARRRANSLPIPLWAVDERWKYSRSWRAYARRERASQRRDRRDERRAALVDKV